MIGNIIIIIALSVIQPIGAYAAGWQDYTLEIGDGYNIERTNSFDKYLIKSGKGDIVSHYRFSEIGPITHYFKNSEYIFLKTVGWKYRNLFEGDDLKEIVDSKTFYFVVQVKDAKVYGPLLEDTFNNHPAVKAAGIFFWSAPRNPNILLPLIGDICFILIAIPIPCIKFWYITIPITLFLIVLYRRRLMYLDRLRGFKFFQSL